MRPQQEVGVTGDMTLKGLYFVSGLNFLTSFHEVNVLSWSQ